MAESKLTKAQLSWLRAFEHESPEEMAWLDAEHRDVNGPPETWVYLSARWGNGATAVIHTDDRDGLEGMFDPGRWALTEAGRAALQLQGGSEQ